KAARLLIGIADRMNLRLVAVHADRNRHGADARAGLQLLFRARPVIENLGTELMAENNVPLRIHAEARARAFGLLDHLVGMMKGVKVRPANTAGKRLHQNLTHFRRRFRNLRSDKIAIAEYSSTHGNTLQEFLVAICKQAPERRAREY